MSWSRTIRQTHRWLSVIFTALVAVNIILNVAAVNEQVTLVVGGITLLPLALLMFTGLYMFVLPYVTRPRAGEAPKGEDGR